MLIHLILSDDWELRGDGSGDMRRIQFDSIRALQKIYAQAGLRGSFNAEIMQQLGHLEIGRKEPHLAALAKEWEDVVKEAILNGHDVQLHTHSQWMQYHYENQRWHLEGQWSILQYPDSDIRKMLTRAKDYLESLIQSVKPDYKCVSYRSGAWCIAPHPHILSILADLGIVFDMSIVQGHHYDLPHIQLDYRNAEEGFFPYYPVMTDARKVSDHPERIVCVPTHGMVRDRIAEFAFRALNRAGKVIPTIAEYYSSPSSFSNELDDYNQKVWAAPSGSAAPPNRLAQIGTRIGQVFAPGQIHRISDIVALSYMEMKGVLADIRKRARASGWETVPVILENHSKNLGYLKPIEKLASLLASSPDIEVITATELAHNIQSGVYPVRTSHDR